MVPVLLVSWDTYQEYAINHSTRAPRPLPKAFQPHAGSLHQYGSKKPDRSFTGSLRSFTQPSGYSGFLYRPAIWGAGPGDRGNKQVHEKGFQTNARASGSIKPNDGCPGPTSVEFSKELDQ